MKTSATFMAWVSSAFLLLSPTYGHAGTAIAESMEWILATTDRVVVGKVIRVDAVRDEANKEWPMITLAISKTLKGTPAERDKVLMRPFINKDFAKQWLDEGIPIVFCLVKNDGKRTSIPAEKCAWVLRDDGNGPSAVLLGKSKNYWTGCISVVTREGDVITDADSILKFLEKAVTAKAKNDDLHSYSLYVPEDTAVYKKLWSEGDSVALVVPVDAQLETLGQRWCKSESSIQRMQGAEILSHFKSDKNIELLKSLLKDTSIRNSTKHRSVPGKTNLELVYRKKVYYVRKAAFDALRKLGVMVDRPILEELLEGKDDQQGERKNGEK